MSRYDRCDSEWRAAKAAEGWELPPEPAGVWRLWGVRHARALWHGYRADKRAGEMATVGIGTGYINPHDEWRLYAIWRGWA